MQTTPSTATPRTANVNVKNLGWTLTNEAEIKKCVSPFEFIGLQQILSKLFTTGIKLRLLYKNGTMDKFPNWSLTNFTEVQKTLTPFEFTGLQRTLNILRTEGVKLQIVYKNIPAGRMKS